ncbi:MAG: GumC family protein [Elsteraceae bacterium]
MSAQGVAPQSIIQEETAKDRFRQSFRWAWRVVWRGKFLIVACVLLFLAPTVLILQQLSPRYTAVTRLLIESPEENDSLLDRGTASRTRVNEAIVLTEAEVLLSPSLAKRVIQKLNLQNDPEFNAALRPPNPVERWLSLLNPIAWIPDAWLSPPDQGVSTEGRSKMADARVLNRFLSRLDVRAERRAFVITVSFASENREKATLIVNTLADLYIVDRLEAGLEDARRVTSWLSERLEALRADVAVAEAAADTYRTQNGLRRRDRNATVGDQQLTELNSRLVLSRADLAQKSARLEQVRALTRSRTGSIDTASDVLNSSLIQRLREQEANVQRDLSDASKTYGERHPRLIGMQADLAELRSKIGLEIQKIAASLANEVEVASVGVRTLEQQLTLLRREGDQAGAAEIKLRELERQADTSRGLYEAFLARFKRDAERERVQRANARILAVANIPVAPSFPRKSMILSVVLTLGAAMGVGLVFLLDRLDGALRSTEDAEELTNLPVLAMIPSGRRRRGQSVDASVIAQPRTPLAEAIRGLRTALQLRERDGGRKVVLVTSSTPREGKSFVSLSLARSFASAGSRTLLIDADVHRPRLRVTAGVTTEIGLAEALRGEATLEEAIVDDPSGPLKIMIAGRTAGREVDLLSEPGMESLLSELSSQFDRIIIDSPPALAVSDTSLLTRIADQVIYLIRWNSTPRDAVRTGVRLLRSSGAPLVGVVLSQVNMRKHKRYGYGDYGHYYGRYGEYYGK